MFNSDIEEIYKCGKIIVRYLNIPSDFKQCNLQLCDKNIFIEEDFKINYDKIKIIGKYQEYYLDDDIILKFEGDVIQIKDNILENTKTILTNNILIYINCYSFDDFNQIKKNYNDLFILYDIHKITLI